MKATEEHPFIFTLKLKVRDYEVDSQGIVNNANYLHYFEHTRHEFCCERGYTFAEMQRRGIDPVVRNININYHRPLGLGEEMCSKLWVERTGARYIFHQSIFNAADELCVDADVTIAVLENGKISRTDVFAI